MGITGTDVAKGSADMILTDDNFSTIVSAIEEGRNIYTNIRKAIIFLLACNFGEIIVLFLSILLNWDTPLLPIHILWVNLITDSFPALSLGIDPLDEDVMNKPPRNPEESIFSGYMNYLFFNGLIIGLISLSAFKIGERLYPNSLIHAQTITFLVLSISQLFFSLNMRNIKKSIFKLGLFKNKYLIFSIIVGVFLQLIIVFVPFLSSVFKVYSLSFKDLAIVFLISLIPFTLNELLKLTLRKKSPLL